MKNLGSNFDGDGHFDILFKIVELENLPNKIRNKVIILLISMIGIDQIRILKILNLLLAEHNEDYLIPW